MKRDELVDNKYGNKNKCKGVEKKWLDAIK